MSEYPFQDLIGVHDVKDSTGAAPRRNVIAFDGATVTDDSVQRETVVTFGSTSSTYQRLSPSAPLQIANANVDTYVLATAQTIYGLGAPSVTQKDFVMVANVSGSPITLPHESTSASSAADRFNFSDGADYVLGDKGILLLWYDRTAARWRGF